MIGAEMERACSPLSTLGVPELPQASSSDAKSGAHEARKKAFKQHKS
jgi:hypothetical protein